jgi:pyruvate dehydrogenase complex dehydrogenase (E1) component
MTADREEPVELPAIGIVGCGLMGSGIAEVFARAGCVVLVHEDDATAAARGRDRIAPSLRQAVSSGKQGTDGFGRSDTRPALRRHFRADAESIIVAALAQPAAGSSIGWDAVVQVARRYRLDDDPYFPHQADCGGEA